MPVRRHLRPLFAFAVVGVVVGLGLTVAGLDTGALLLSPALALLVPLVAGRYPGERGLTRLVARRIPRRPRAASIALPRRRPRSTHRRGARALAAALAERGPPLGA
jgi:hypothetical protein